MAGMRFDKVHVVNTALSKLGLEASYSIDDESPLGGKVDMAWLGVVAEVMMLHPWQQMRETVAVTQLARPPANGWQYGFALPADRVGDPLAILTDVVRETYLRSFMLEGGKLFTNVTPVWVRVRKATDPQTWDMAFREAFAMALAGALAVPLLQDDDTEALRRRDAFGDPRELGGGGLFGKLIAVERAAQPQGRNFLTNSPLIAARK